MNSFKFEIATLTQTQGQTVCLTLQGVNRVFYSENSIWKSKRFGEELSPTWSSSVADPSHSPIERGQRHGPLRREKKEEEIIKKINVIEKKKLRSTLLKSLQDQPYYVGLTPTFRFHDKPTSAFVIDYDAAALQLEGNAPVAEEGKLVDAPSAIQTSLGSDDLPCLID